MPMDTLALRCHRQQSTRTYRSFVSTHDAASKMSTYVRFNTYFFCIGIDSFTSAYISPIREKFISYTEERGYECKVIASGLNIAGRGTLNFKIEDDNERTHDISVLDAVHIPDLTFFLLSPHHWAHNSTDRTTEKPARRQRCSVFAATQRRFV